MRIETLLSCPGCSAARKWCAAEPGDMILLDVFLGPGLCGAPKRCAASGTRGRVPAARFARALNSYPLKEGAGNAGCFSQHPRPRVQIEKAHEQVTTGESRYTSIPCAMVLRFPSRSPRRPGFVASVIGAMQSIVANLTPALVCQDHTTSPSAHSTARQSM